jgi:hypothetical protein
VISSFFGGKLCDCVIRRTGRRAWLAWRQKNIALYGSTGRY